MDHRRSGGYRDIIASSNNADKSPFAASVHKGPVHEERLEFFRLRRNVNEYELPTRTGSCLDLYGIGRRV